MRRKDELGEVVGEEGEKMDDAEVLYAVEQGKDRRRRREGDEIEELKDSL